LGRSPADGASAISGSESTNTSLSVTSVVLTPPLPGLRGGEPARRRRVGDRPPAECRHRSRMTRDLRRPRHRRAPDSARRRQEPPVSQRAGTHGHDRWRAASGKLDPGALTVATARKAHEEIGVVVDPERLRTTGATKSPIGSGSSSRPPAGRANRSTANRNEWLRLRWFTVHDCPTTSFTARPLTSDATSTPAPTSRSTDGPPRRRTDHIARRRPGDVRGLVVVPVIPGTGAGARREGGVSGR